MSASKTWFLRNTDALAITAIGRLAPRLLTVRLFPLVRLLFPSILTRRLLTSTTLKDYFHQD